MANRFIIKIKYVLYLIILFYSCNQDPTDIYGCIDIYACNFNLEATIDDNSCEYAEEFYTCDSICQNDLDNDSICDEMENVGCLDITACNYDINATDEGICEYADEFYDCNGECIGDVDDDGICDGIDINYSVEDIIGNIYESIIIGEQEWMAENLKTTSYQNGDTIHYVSYSTGWYGSSIGSYGEYNNDINNTEIYGKLYNWFAVNDERGVCPIGWHVPTDNDFKLLEQQLGMSQDDSDAYGWRGINEGSKIAGFSNIWEDGELENDFDFGASGLNFLPSGQLDLHHGGFYVGMDLNAYFWVSSSSNNFDAWVRGLNYNKTQINRIQNDKNQANSLRCVRDIE